MLDKEKEQKVAQIVEDLEDLTIDCTCIGITKDECDKCFRRMIAKYVLEREEKAQKERTKEILLRVKSFLEEQTKTVKQLSNPSMGSYAIPQNCVECYEGSQDNRLDELSRIAKEFGAEIEE